MKRKNLVLAAAAAASAIIMSTFGITAYADQWQSDNNGWWYQYSSGSYAKGWNRVGDKWYYFDENGYMKTGWIQQNGKWYFCYTNGVMHVGRLELSGKSYYMNENGEMQTGIFTDGNYYYQTESDGSLIQNTVRNTTRYDESGCMMLRDAKGSWTYVGSVEDRIFMAKSTLQEEYLDHKYRSQAAFEAKVRQVFNGTWTEDEILDFIYEMETLFYDYYDSTYDNYRE